MSLSLSVKIMSWTRHFFWDESLHRTVACVVCDVCVERIVLLHNCKLNYIVCFPPLYDDIHEPHKKNGIIKLRW